MDQRFEIHNTHWVDPENFHTLDPQLRRLHNAPYVFISPVVQQLPINIPGIYTIGGGRQIGKTTLLKLWMEELLKKGIHPRQILFLSGEMIEDFHSLLFIIQTHLELMPDDKIRYLLIDEITYIKDWDRTIKHLADSGSFDNIEVVLTGSDLVMMHEARMRFPGRRGIADQVDFHIYPLSFKEFVDLKHGFMIPENEIPTLFALLDEYLLHGGYLTAINDYARFNMINKATLLTYSDWIRGDFFKRGKQETSLREVLDACIKTYGTQVTWNSLCQHISIEQPKTVQDYVMLLESMDAVFVQSALLEHKLMAAPKKAKKVLFTDPFIYHATRLWLDGRYIPLSNPNETPALIETIVVTHIRRFYPTFYIKAEGEVDVAYIHENVFWPIEVKWTNQLRSKDLKQIQKYRNGIILSKSVTKGMIHDIPSVPLPLFLYNFPE